jgi:hypothetical protein
MLKIDHELASHRSVGTVPHEVYSSEQNYDVMCEIGGGGSRLPLRGNSLMSISMIFEAVVHLLQILIEVG